MKKISKQRFLKNLGFAFGAQIVSYVLSVITGLVAPKMLGVEEFGYWQLFVFYGTYVNFAMLGVHDGMYLRLGGKEVDSIDKKRESSQFHIVMSFNILISLCLVIWGLCFFNDDKRKYVFCSVAIYLVLTNACQYIGEMFQAVNNSYIFSISTLINKAVTLVAIIILLLVGITSFQPYIIAFLLASAATLVYYLAVGRKVVLCRSKLNFHNTLNGIKNDINSGWKIMVGGYAGLLIIGSGRAIIDKLWGISTFGKLSMAISLINMALQFVNQIAIVLFPAIRTFDSENQKNIYTHIKRGLHFSLPLIYFFYIPLVWFISAWLPQYGDAITYLGIILPICVFDAKTNMLNLTYLKVQRREADILNVNLFTLILNLFLIGIAYLLFGDVESILVAMVISVAVRAVIFDMKLEENSKQKSLYSDFYDVVIAACFIVINRLNGKLLLPVMICAYVLLLAINRNECISLYKWLKTRKG